MKLGLLAFSGVRTADPELLQRGMTLPGFASRMETIAQLPSLGLLTLAGMVPEGSLELEYFEVDRPPDVGLPLEADAVAISALSARIKDGYAIADRYRAHGIPVILGGLHVTATPEEAALHADAIVLGEAEIVWNQVLRDLQSGTLAPVYDARNRNFDLSTAPIPRFDLLDADRYARLTVQTQRGCPYDCEFCAASIRLSPGFRTKPVENVVREIRTILELNPQPFLEFADDNTFANKRHGKALLRALAPLGVRWFTESDVSVADDEELLGLMRDSGCRQVLIGFEHPAAKALRGVERKSDWKARRTDYYLEAVRKIQSHGISVNGCFVLGLDGTGPESFQEISEFVEESGLTDVQLTVQTPFPGTPLYERLLGEDRLLEPTAWERCTLFDINFQPDRMTVQELRMGFLQLAASVYSEESAVARRKEFFRSLRGEEQRASRLKGAGHERKAG